MTAGIQAFDFKRDVFTSLVFPGHPEIRSRQKLCHVDVRTDLFNASEKSGFACTYPSVMTEYLDKDVQYIQ